MKTYRYKRLATLDSLQWRERGFKGGGAAPPCSMKIRKAGVRGMDAYFCPRCQPATRSGLVDWTKTGK